MIKHVGRHNNAKVAIIFRQVPDEDHMCLLVYPDMLPARIHDEVMQVLESAMGQESKDLADALFRHVMKDGNNCLNALHRSDLMKKIPTNQVIITPSTNASIRLDELNTMLNQIEQGGEALKRMKEVDDNLGMRGNHELNKAMEGKQQSVADLSQQASAVTQPGVLTDDMLASNLTSQAEKMRASAEAMIAEAVRLEQEAADLLPKKKPTNARKSTKKATA